ncbi:MAG: substrate-binding domain-containing protein [Haloferacaceae archaeon]
MNATRRAALRAFGGAVAVGAAGSVAYGRATTGSDRDPAAMVAGSLLRVADRLGGATVEAHGSAGVRRLLVEGARDPDTVALADPRLFDGIAARATLFATNALVLAYDPASPAADALRRDWRAALTRDGIAIGRTDPDVDPLGYRTVMALRLAARDGGPDADRVLDRSTAFRETDLLNVLERGGVDAAFAYRNMAVERDLPYVTLPDRIDFSAPALGDVYASVAYELPHTTVRGAPIRYAATPLTPAGRPWVERLVTAGDLLADAGFHVPEAFPRRDVPVGGPR